MSTERKPIPEPAAPVERLVSCPFCGGTGYLENILRDGYKDFPDDPDARAYCVRCRSCAAEGPWAKSEYGARRLWNIRVS